MKREFAVCDWSEKLGSGSIVDVNHGDLQSLKREGVNLFLIPEDIARYIDYSSVSKDECFKLTHDEYESGNIDRVVKYIEENWNIIS